MTFKDLIKLYEKYKKKYGNEAYKHISELFDEAKIQHKKDWLKAPTPARDFEQSWKPIKGHGLENLILYIIQSEVESLGLKVISGEKFEKTNGGNLTEELSKVKRNVSVDFGEFGLHVPDADLIIYNPRDCKILAILSSKTTLRERIAQTGYWKIKLSKDPITRHIKVFFITPDTDNTLTYKKPTKKGRAIVETDTDGSYVMTTRKIEESDKVKMFDKFIEDLKNLIKNE
jgi:type II restriction enzyme